MTFLADQPATLPIPPRFAFAIPRKVGNAVERNRIRRVVQGRMISRVRAAEPGLAAGSYLVAVRSGSGRVDAVTVADDVEACLDSLRTRR